MLVGTGALVRLDQLLDSIELVGYPADQRVDAIGQVVREVVHDLGCCLRPFPRLQVLEQIGHRLQRPQAQRDHPARVGEYPQRNHVFRLRARIQVHSTEEHQQAFGPEIEQTGAGRLLQQQIAGELAEPRGIPQPGLCLRYAAVPVQPKTFLRQQVEHRYLVASDTASAAAPVEDVAIDQAALVTRLVRLHCASLGKTTISTVKTQVRYQSIHGLAAQP